MWVVALFDMIGYSIEFLRYERERKREGRGKKVGKVYPTSLMLEGVTVWQCRSKFVMQGAF